jgi:hypothetical protein
MSQGAKLDDALGDATRPREARRSDEMGRSERDSGDMAAKHGGQGAGCQLFDDEDVTIGATPA